jgi:outer membrane protein assembly factor BamB
MVVTCWTVDGDRVWEKVPGRFYSRHGYCSPPVLYKDLVVLNGDQDAAAFLVALDRATGRERWRADRPNRTRSYCPPLVIDAAGRKELVLSGSKCVAGYDPDTGRRLWRLDGPTEQFVASLVCAGGVLFLTAGYPEYHNMGIRPGAARADVLWHEKRVSPRKAAYVPSPVASGPYFFLVSDVGYAQCFDGRTGRRLWMHALGAHHSASAVAAEGRLYFVADDGATYVLKAGPTFELLSRNEIGEECRASPAVAHGQIFLRSLHHLWCLGPTEAGVGR